MGRSGQVARRPNEIKFVAQERAITLIDKSNTEITSKRLPHQANLTTFYACIVLLFRLLYFNFPLSDNLYTRWADLNLEHGRNIYVQCPPLFILVLPTD